MCVSLGEAKLVRINPTNGETVVEQFTICVWFAKTGSSTLIGYQI